MPKYTLDPTQLGDDVTDSDKSTPTKALLRDLLAVLITQTRSPFISPGIYTIFYKKQITSLQLTHGLLKRPRAHKENETRIEILNDHPFNNGGFGNIYESQGILVPENEYRFKRKSLEHSRICKIMPYNNPPHKQMIRQEALNTAMNPMLHCKKAVFAHHYGFIIMRHAQQSDLYELYEPLKSDTIILTIEQRFQLTYNIMNAIQQQAHGLGLIHNDIKPENLIINWETLAVTLIDYYFAQPIDELQEAKSATYGSPSYIAPEIFENEKRTIKSDIFSLGLTLAYLWGDTSAYSLTVEEFLQNPQYFYQNRVWINLFDSLTLQEQIKQKITGHFDGMTELSPQKRISLTQAMESWLCIQKEYLKTKCEKINLAAGEFGLFKTTPKNNPQHTVTPATSEPGIEIGPGQ